MLVLHVFCSGCSHIPTAYSSLLKSLALCMCNDATVAISTYSRQTAVSSVLASQQTFWLPGSQTPGSSFETFQRTQPCSQETDPQVNTFLLGCLKVHFQRFVTPLPLAERLQRSEEAREVQIAVIVQVHHLEFAVQEPGEKLKILLPLPPQEFTHMEYSKQNQVT